MHLSAFIASSACIHKIMEQTYDESKFLGSNCTSLLATLLLLLLLSLLLLLLLLLLLI